MLLLDAMYVGMGKRPEMAVRVMYIWKKENQSAAQWMHADSMHQNNVKALVCLSPMGCSATRILPYNMLKGPPLLATKAGTEPTSQQVKERFSELHTMSCSPVYLNEVYKKTAEPRYPTG